MLAHLLTALRFALVFPLAAAFARPAFLDPGPTALLLAAGLASDYFDGVVARRRRTASPGGQLFDHATDCFFVTACLGGASAAGHVPWLLPVVIAVAFTQYVVDSYWIQRRKRLRMSRIGRWNGIAYFAPLVIIAAARLDLVPVLTPPLLSLAGAVAWLLIASTLVSIADRATAVRRSARKGERSG